MITPTPDQVMSAMLAFDDAIGMHEPTLARRLAAMRAALTDVLNKGISYDLSAPPFAASQARGAPD